MILLPSIDLNEEICSVTEREIRRATVESNRSNVIGIIRDFVNPYVETPLDAKFIGKKSLSALLLLELFLFFRQT